MIMIMDSDNDNDNDDDKMSNVILTLNKQDSHSTR